MYFTEVPHFHPSTRKDGACWGPRFLPARCVRSRRISRSPFPPFGPIVSPSRAVLRNSWRLFEIGAAQHWPTIAQLYLRRGGRLNFSRGSAGFGRSAK